MAEPLLTSLFGLKAVGGYVVGWAAGKGLDKGTVAGWDVMQKRLSDKGLDPSHDIEAAILTAHYEALQFIVEQTFAAHKTDKRVEAYSARLSYLRGPQGFKRLFKEIEARDFAGLLTGLSEGWKATVPAGLETAVTGDDLVAGFPAVYVGAAADDLLALVAWSEVEAQALTEMFAHPEVGWAQSFPAQLRAQIKTNTPFYRIFMAQHQASQTTMLAVLCEQVRGPLAPSAALLAAIDNIQSGVDEANERLERIEDKVDKIVTKGHYTNDVGHHYPKYLAALLFQTDVPEAQWEDEISAALTAYVGGRKALHTLTNLPADLEAKRKKALTLYEQAKLDEGEAILQALIDAHREHLEGQSRGHAQLLIDQTQFAVAKLDYERAIDLYEEAAHTVLAFDKLQAINWLRAGALLAYNRGLLTGGGFLQRSEQLYGVCLSHIPQDKNGVSPEWRDAWAGIQNNIGLVYWVLGSRGEAGALEKAVTAFEQALTVYTPDTAPMDWAMTQNNLGIVYRVLGSRGEAGALEKAVAAYEQALTVRTPDTAPMDWASTQNNLGIVYSVLGERGEAGALESAVSAYEQALTVWTPETALMDWAMAQNNLGLVYQVLGERGEAGALEKAVFAYEQALTVYTADTAPMDWAMTQNNLGIVYQVLGALEKAVAAYEQALTIRTPETAPLDWAGTQNNLGNVYSVLGSRGEAGALEKAVSAFEQALTVRTPDTAPMDWAMTVENLGYALWALSEKERSEQCFRDALREFRKQDASWYVEKLEAQMRSRGLEP